MATPEFSNAKSQRDEHIAEMAAMFPLHSARFQRTPRPILFALVMVLGTLVSGCTGLPTSETVSIPGNTEPRVENVNAAIPTPGTGIAIRGGAMGGLVTVTFGESYMAASGRRCAYYFEPGTDIVANKRPSGIACQATIGGWTRISRSIPVTPGP